VVLIVRRHLPVALGRVFEEYPIKVYLRADIDTQNRLDAEQVNIVDDDEAMDHDDEAKPPTLDYASKRSRSPNWSGSTRLAVLSCVASCASIMIPIVYFNEGLLPDERFTVSVGLTFAAVTGATSIAKANGEVRSGRMLVSTAMFIDFAVVSLLTLAVAFFFSARWIH